MISDSENEQFKEIAAGLSDDMPRWPGDTKYRGLWPWIVVAVGLATVLAGLVSQMVPLALTGFIAVALGWVWRTVEARRPARRAGSHAATTAPSTGGLMSRVNAWAEARWEKRRQDRDF